jgi:hypothetical protein
MSWKNFIKGIKETPQSKGLGDTIAKATKAVGIKPCNACKKRQEKLNKIFPYEINHIKE